MSEDYRLARFAIVIIAVFWLVTFASGSYRSFIQERAYIWGTVEHESGQSVWNIRRDSVIAIVEWDTDSEEAIGYKTELILANGKSLKSHLTVAEIQHRLHFERYNPPPKE